MSEILTSQRPPKRKVWVLNRHPQKEYRELYRDTEYVIPPNSQKKVIMDLLTAEKFLSQGVMPQQFDQAGRELTIGKPLYWEDLTAEEQQKLDPHSQKEAKKEEKALEHLCTICGNQLPSKKGLQLHTIRKHPGYEPIKEP